MVKFCKHCQEVNPDPKDDFCCLGCKSAFNIINGFGLSQYYLQRIVSTAVKKLKPEEEKLADIDEFIQEKNGIFSVLTSIQGMHCAACVWLIESILKKQKNVTKARINLSKKTLFLEFIGNDKKYANQLIDIIQKIGYKILPLDQQILNREEKKYDDSIVKSLAIAGFGMGNIMLFSLIFWLYPSSEIGENTKNLMQFFSSLIALPVIIFSSRPFFSSATKSIKAGFPNMDLAISVAIFLACLVSFLETFRNASHIYFDSAVMLIFFLLIGRYLDAKARRKAFNIAAEFSLLAASFGRVIEQNAVKIIPSKKLKEGMILLVAAGEKIAADGVVIDGESNVDFAIINGESLPKKISVGNNVFGGTINLESPLKIKITKSPQNSLLAEIIALSEEVESQKNSYVRIADKLAKIYLPAVHILAIATFIFWLKNGWEIAMMNATAVLIITCPCALALAVPIVQTILISNFIKKGVLVKSGEALEKLDQIDNIIFDKTGSLTIGEIKFSEIHAIKNGQKISLEQSQKKLALKLAASLAQNSRHPISQAICQEFRGELLTLKTAEIAGLGLIAEYENKPVKLGKEKFCETQKFQNDDCVMQTFLKYDEQDFVLTFADEIKQDALETILELKKISRNIILLSGDNEKNVRKIATEIGISEFYYEKNPLEKVTFLQQLKAKKQNILMIGDGLNDAPSLALADVSISFSKASDISQNIADIVIQGKNLMPIFGVIKSAKKSLKLMRQNLAIALIYNILAIPFAITGQVIPLIAAAAMSSSSLIVLLNSFRINSKKCQF